MTTPPNVPRAASASARCATRRASMAADISSSTVATANNMPQAVA